MVVGDRAWCGSGRDGSLSVTAPPLALCGVGGCGLASIGGGLQVFFSVFISLVLIIVYGAVLDYV